jgi:transposase InsO family protein
MVANNARQASWHLQEETDRPLRFPIRDRDGKFPTSFDRIFVSEGIPAVKTPPRAPNANAVAGRVVRTIHAECLDRLLVVNQVHLRSVLAEYAAYYNHRRPHQGRAQRPPVPDDDAPARPVSPTQVRRHPVLGGLINDYCVAA